MSSGTPPLLKKLNVNKSTNDDQILTKSIVITDDVMSPYFAYHVDFMFSNGICPNALKIEKVIPLHKSGSKQAVESYRPISLLSPLSKIVEKLIQTSLVSFLNKNKILLKDKAVFVKNILPCFL